MFYVIIAIVTTTLLAMIAVALFGILTALKSGFTEIIKGLESLDDRLSRDESETSDVGKS